MSYLTVLQKIALLQKRAAQINPNVTLKVDQNLLNSLASPARSITLPATGNNNTQTTLADLRNLIDDPTHKALKNSLIAELNKLRDKKLEEGLKGANRAEMIDYLKGIKGDSSLADLGVNILGQMGNQQVTIPVGAGLGYGISTLAGTNPILSGLLGAGVGALTPDLSEAAMRKLIFRSDYNAPEAYATDTALGKDFSV